MVLSTARRLLKPVLYTTSVTVIAGGLVYWTNRPRSLPGSNAPAVPPPGYGGGGKLRPPTFPLLSSRAEQISRLEASGRVADGAGAVDVDEVYDLLIIGGGATGSGIALDAVTRGLKVALVERDDFGSGTSSKSTKLVHGGVRYLEKAVWDLDYNQ